MNNELITHSFENKSSPVELQLFGEALFSYLITQGYLTSKVVNNELDYWSKLCYSWSNLVLSGEHYLKIKNVSKLNELSAQKPNTLVCEKILRIILNNFPNHADVNRRRIKTAKSFKLNRVFSDAVITNKKITGLDDFKLVSSAIKYLANFSIKQDLPNAKHKHKTHAKHQKKDIHLLDDLKKIFTTSILFRKKVYSNKLQKRFNRTLALWLNDVRKERIHRKPDNNTHAILRTGYSYLLLLFINEIIKILKTVKREKYISPPKFDKLVLFEILYYFFLMNYSNAQAKLNPYLDKEETTSELNRAFVELKKVNQTYWLFHKQWQGRCSNYLKNMSKRANLAFIREHIKITTNPIILRGMRGGQSRSKLILGNNGSCTIALNPHLALPSIHWNLVEPEANMVNNIYNLKRVVITPKQTKEIPINIAFPRSLSFPNYSAILRLNAKPIKLIPEID